jgi:hypothetical protein
VKTVVRVLDMAVALLFALALATSACSSGALHRPRIDANADQDGPSIPGGNDGAATEVSAEADGSEAADDAKAADGAADGADGADAADGAQACQPSSPCFPAILVFDPSRCECVPAPATSCSATIDAFCATDAGGAGPTCVRTWSASPDPAQWCRSPTDNLRYYPGCDGFNLVVRAFIDTALVYYYDVATLQLVRVESTNYVTAHCTAGVPGLVAVPGRCTTGTAIPCR